MKSVSTLARSNDLPHFPQAIVGAETLDRALLEGQHMLQTKSLHSKIMMKTSRRVGSWDHGRSQLTHAPSGNQSALESTPLTNVPQRL